MKDIWALLSRTGNGIGNAPQSLRSIPDIDGEKFDEILWDELENNFLHQGSVYCSTPYAIKEVLDVLPRTSEERQGPLLSWMLRCLKAEKLGAAEASHAGVWIEPHELASLSLGGNTRPTIHAVLVERASLFRKLVDSKNSDVSKFAASVVQILDV